MLDENEYERWMKSAKHTLRSAKADRKGGDYNWACFKAHQAAEKAIKALLYGLGLPTYRRSISKLVTKIPRTIKPKRKIMQDAKSLDKLCIPTRYPNAWIEGTPEEYYTSRDAKEAIKSCLLYTSPSPRDLSTSRMPSSA